MYTLKKNGFRVAGNVAATIVYIKVFQRSELYLPDRLLYSYRDCVAREYDPIEVYIVLWV